MMTIQEFGDALIHTEDLDPVYCGLARAKLPEPQLCRLLLAYLLFYSLGASAWLSEHEGQDYWKQLRIAAENIVAAPNGGRWPRGGERRHFRGRKCVEAISWFGSRSPEHYVRALSDARTEIEIMDRVKGWPMCGDWASFKAADMMERVYGAPIAFDRNIGIIYESPRKGLLLAAGNENALWSAYEELLAHFGRQAAPPRYDRKCGPAECETIACKFHAYVGGHYWVGHDIKETRHALMGWGTTADKILASFPAEVPGGHHFISYMSRNAS